MKSGSVEQELLQEITALEESLWRAATRFDDALMARRFAADFAEFGRSGKRYTRDEMFFGASDLPEIPARLPLHEFKARWIDRDTILTTYISELAYPDGLQWANRSSIWSRAGTGWQLRFHQGTAAAAPLPLA